MSDVRRLRGLAQHVSRQLRKRWDFDSFTFPTVTQAGPKVLVEAVDFGSLGLAAWTLSQHGYRIEVGGQWLTDEHGFEHWNGWLMVSRSDAGRAR